MKKSNDGFDGIRDFLGQLGNAAQQIKAHNPKLKKEQAIHLGLKKVIEKGASPSEPKKKDAPIINLHDKRKM